MNRREYQLHLDGYQAAAHGAGLSDSPHGGADGFIWRQGVSAWLDENGPAGGSRSDELDRLPCVDMAGKGLSKRLKDDVGEMLKHT
jgi:hypothetical protein